MTLQEKSKAVDPVVDETKTGGDRAALVWQAIRALLEEAKKPIDRAIRETPPPIPACDARFNHLLEERSRIVRELNRLDALSAQTVSCRTIDDFLAASAFIDATAAIALRDRFKEAFAALEKGAEAGGGPAR